VSLFLGIAAAIMTGVATFAFMSGNKMFAIYTLLLVIACYMIHIASLLEAING